MYTHMHRDCTVIHTHMYARIRTGMQLHKHTYMLAHMYIYIYICAYKHAYIFACKHSIRVCMHIRAAIAHAFLFHAWCQRQLLACKITVFYGVFSYCDLLYLLPYGSSGLPSGSHEGPFNHLDRLVRIVCSKSWAWEAATRSVATHLDCSVLVVAIVAEQTIVSVFPYLGQCRNDHHTISPTFEQLWFSANRVRRCWVRLACSLHVQHNGR